VEDRGAAVQRAVQRHRVEQVHDGVVRSRVAPGVGNVEHHHLMAGLGQPVHHV
jgi:hypothetical protein